MKQAKKPTRHRAPQFGCAWASRHFPLVSLSRRQMRKRLFAAGLRGTQIKTAVTVLQTGPVRQDRLEGLMDLALGWPIRDLQRMFGHRVAYRLLRGVWQATVYRCGPEQ